MQIVRQSEACCIHHLPGEYTNAEDLKAVMRIRHSLVLNTTYSPSAFKERNSSVLLSFSEAEKGMSSSFQLKYRTSLRQTVRLKWRKK